MNLIESAKAGDIEQVRHLSANLNSPRDIYLAKEAFRIAVASGNLDILKLLIRYVDINMPDQHAQYPLHIAAANQHPLIVRYLLDNLADIDAVDELGFTALFHAIDSEIEAAMSLADALGCYIPPCAITSALLIAQGADVTTTAKDGTAALDIADNIHFMAAILIKERME